MSTIVICAFDNTLASALLGIKDLFSLSGLEFLHNNHSKFKKEGFWKPDVILASHDGMPITDGHDRAISVDTDILSIKRCDAVLIPGFVPDNHGHPPKKTTSQDIHQWLIKQHSQGALLCGSCSGSFVLGESGLLNNRRCTTTWWLHDELRSRYPKALAAWASEMITDNSIVTAGGPLSWVDITLHVVEKLAGSEFAKLMADYSVVDTFPKSQKVYVQSAHLTSVDPFLAEAEFVIRKAHYQHISAPDLANQMSVSLRTLNRKIKNLTEETPKSFIDKTRISYACTLLNSAKKPIKDISFALGYSDDTVFRRLFKKHMGMNPSTYRKRLSK